MGEHGRFSLLNRAEKEGRFYGVRDQEPGTAYTLLRISEAKWNMWK